MDARKAELKANPPTRSGAPVRSKGIQSSIVYPCINGTELTHKEREENNKPHNKVWKWCADTRLPLRTKIVNSCMGCGPKCFGYVADNPELLELGLPESQSPFAKEFHAELARTKEIPYPEGRYKGRGMVICAGGWKSLPGVFVAANFMRWEHNNSKLPIEVLYIGDRGEFDPLFHHITKGLNVTWVNASEKARELGFWPRKEELRGWAIKPLALMLSSFEQIVMIDQDCYPVYDPERLWDDPRIGEKAAAFWPDNQSHVCGKPLTEEQWGFFGLRKPAETIPGIESGQMIVDKRKSWHAVQMCAFLSDRFNEFDRTRGKVNGHHGDKDCFTVAWTATNTPFYVAPETKHHEVAYLQHDPDGNVAFVHRCNDKPRVDFQEIKMTTQAFEHGQFRSATLHHEHMFHEYLKRLSRTLRPQIPGFRDNTQDVQIWNEIRILNTYRLPKRMDEMCVLDVGAHAGFFALECLKRGAELVVCVEPYRPNLDQLRMNLAPWTAKSQVIEAAIAGEPGEVRIRGSLHGANYTGEPHVAGAISDYPNLWVGNWKAAKERSGVRITCAVDSPFTGEEFFPLVDGPGNKPELLRDAISSAVGHLRSGNPVNIHCVAGISRSATVAAAALATLWRCSFSGALAKVRQRFPQVDPAPALVELAEQFIPPAEGIPVKAVTLDSLIGRLEHVDLLKIDAEGGEYPAILGSESLACVDRIALEWHSHAECEGTPEHLVAKLESVGFTVEWSGKENGIGMIHATRHDFPLTERANERSAKADTATSGSMASRVT